MRYEVDEEGWGRGRAWAGTLDGFRLTGRLTGTGRLAPGGRSALCRGVADEAGETVGHAAEPAERGVDEVCRVAGRGHHIEGHEDPETPWPQNLLHARPLNDPATGNRSAVDEEPATPPRPDL